MNRAFLQNLGINDKEVIDELLDKHSSIIGDIKRETINNNVKIEFLTNQKIELEEKINSLDQEIGKYSSSVEDVESLKKTIEDLQNTNKENDENHKNEMNELRKSFAIENALRDAKARNVISVKALIDLEKVELNEDGTLKGLSEQIETLSKDEGTKFLFDTETRTLKGAISGETGMDDPSTKIDLSKMTYDERNAYFEGDFD